MIESGTRGRVDIWGYPEPQFDDTVTGVVIRHVPGQNAILIRLDTTIEGVENPLMTRPERFAPN